ncbi:predicted protein [Sclerotinia sclerotiorum 1980 UF-70]|uniref:Uncharacterized protein n=2 Tax=Sclerotinia sclerotiorum (strain ATCC 18683 / 1980 / Ss-1) TaxID=665079 RepID=A7EU02_SCLS1|nr:predicted protein [Sclerotinia sclerotiorum 1980 UF-70]APA15198.1 hypothetical protein sscle_14g099680 [Sclerotinia sclerotiorum 1980 UF-70]EDN92944.1 predicted protein [Sclerotinia sclerotiorum 1980 UF-70]
MDSPPPPYSVSEGAPENQAAPEYTTLLADEHPRTQPSPPPYTPLVTANANTNSDSTGYKLCLKNTSLRISWTGPINAFEGNNVIQITRAVGRDLGVLVWDPRFTLYYSIISPAGKKIRDGFMFGDCRAVTAKLSDDGRVKVPYAMLL